MKKINFKILKNFRLIVETYIGDITANDLISQKARIAESKDFNTNFNIINDFRDAHISIKKDEIEKVVNYFKSNPVFQQERKIAYLSGNPNEVALSTLFSNKIKDYALTTKVFSTFEAASDFLGIQLDTKDFNNIISELKENMNLEDLGYTDDLENFRIEQNLDSFKVGRIISEHRERYIVKTTENEFEGEIIGNLRFSAQKRSDFPAVGDWVAISEYEENKVLIHVVYPRKNVIERKSVGKYGNKQIIASNIDFGFIVQAVDRDFSINRIERYLTICYTSNVKPIIILNKTDLISESVTTNLINKVKERVDHIPVIGLSNETKKGYEFLKSFIIKGKTYCLLGSSGVGKSTLLNNLSDQQTMKTDTISESTQRGRHITSHRELVILKNGGLLIDNPGMREVGIADSGKGIEQTFDEISRLAYQCKFIDCTHTNETGCLVLNALKKGTLDKDAYENYLKMSKEKAHFEMTASEKRKKGKDMAKLIKNYKRDKKKNNF